MHALSLAAAINPQVCMQLHTLRCAGCALRELRAARSAACAQPMVLHGLVPRPDQVNSSCPTNHKSAMCMTSSTAHLCCEGWMRRTPWQPRLKSARSATWQRSSAAGRGRGSAAAEHCMREHGALVSSSELGQSERLICQTQLARTLHFTCMTAGLCVRDCGRGKVCIALFQYTHTQAADRPAVFLRRRASERQTRLGSCDVSTRLAKCLMLRRRGTEYRSDQMPVLCALVPNSVH